MADSESMDRANGRHLRRVVLLGLVAVDSLEIKWPAPSNKVESFRDLPLDRYISIVEGKGVADKEGGASGRLGGGSH